MGPVEQTRNDAEADAFFAQFIDASPETIERVTAERGGNIAAVVAEQKAFGYWDRKIAARDARRIERYRLAALERAQTAADSAATHAPQEHARRTPLPEQSTVLLPERRYVILTDPEYNDTRRWWHRLENPTTARSLARRIRNEIRDAEQHQRRTARETAAWQTEQRAFERAQWRAVVANRNSRPQRKTANQWVAIDENRALAVALAALHNTTPPQAKN